MLYHSHRKLLLPWYSSIKEGYKYSFYHHHIAIVGTGPSGLYTAKYLIEQYCQKQLLLLQGKNSNHQQQQQLQQHDVYDINHQK